MGFLPYLYFCISGVELDARRARVLERLWIGTGYPDPRIWCNRVAGYLGSARVDPALALCAALAASNSQLYGFGALARAYLVQTTIPEDLATRSTWLEEQLRCHTKFAGYGRPISGSDERILAGFSALAEEGLVAGSALRRADWLHQQLKRLKGVEMNAAALWAAVCIDFEMNYQDFTQFHLLMFVPGYMAVYGEQRSRPPLTFLHCADANDPTPCERPEAACPDHTVLP
jgi:citrate synthase